MCSSGREEAISSTRRWLCPIRRQLFPQTMCRRRFPRRCRAIRPSRQAGLRLRLAAGRWVAALCSGALEKQYRMIHDLQPWCLIGNNHHQTPFPGEDIQIFERDLPGENSAGLSGQAISRLPLISLYLKLDDMVGCFGVWLHGDDGLSVPGLLELYGTPSERSNACQRGQDTEVHRLPRTARLGTRRSGKPHGIPTAGSIDGGTRCRRVHTQREGLLSAGGRCRCRCRRRESKPRLRFRRIRMPLPHGCLQRVHTQRDIAANSTGTARADEYHIGRHSHHR